MQASSVDLNLLLVLAALLETGSVKQAASRLALSPSATSHALARLRDALGDPILVRAGRTMVLTARAEALIPQVRRIVEESEAVFRRGAGFDAAQLRRGFRVFANDYEELLLIGPLSRRLALEAPLVDLYSLPTPPSVIEPLRRGECDVALGVFGDLPPDIGVQRLFADEFVCLLRENHPALGERWTKKRFAALQHILVAPRGTPRGIVDNMLAEQGLERRVARTVTTFIVAPHLVAGSDFVLTIARRVATLLASGLGLVLRKPPVAPQGFHVGMAWHRRYDQDPEHQFLRERIVEEARRL